MGQRRQKQTVSLRQSRPSGETDMQAQADRQLTLQSLIDDLHRQQLLNDDDYQLALSIRRKQDEVNLHPLTLLGRQGYADARRQGKSDEKKNFENCKKYR